MSIINCGWKGDALKYSVLNATNEMPLNIKH